MNPGDLIWIDFPGVVQTKRRPAVVLSSATYHASRPDIIVGLVTSQTAKATAPTNHLIRDWRPAGLRVPSAFRAFIVTLPGRERKIKGVGENKRGRESLPSPRAATPRSRRRSLGQTRTHRQ